MATSTWNIDSSHSTAEFTVRHLMISKVRGRFNTISGTIVLDEADITRSSVDVAIDVASVSTGDEKRDEHLRSADFFSADVNPTITFKSTKIVPDGDEFKVEGNLTINGVTQPVTLEAESGGQVVNPWGQTVAAFSAETKISRKDFGLTWNAPLEAGGVTVSDEVRIALEIEATKQA